MTTKEDILRGVEEIVKDTADAADAEPVFEIICFQHANKELVGKSGKPLGFPDFGTTDPVGFFHDIEDAVNYSHFKKGASCFDEPGYCQSADGTVFPGPPQA